MKMESIVKKKEWVTPQLTRLPAGVARARLAAACACLTPSNASRPEPDKD